MKLSELKTADGVTIVDHVGELWLVTDGDMPMSILPVLSYEPVANAVGKVELRPALWMLRWQDGSEHAGNAADALPSKWVYAASFRKPINLSNVYASRSAALRAIARRHLERSHELIMEAMRIDFDDAVAPLTREPSRQPDKVEVA